MTKNESFKGVVIMSSYFDGVNSYSDSFNFFDYMGTGSSQSNSSSMLSSSLMDLQMIKSGSYKKALKAYYAKNPVKKSEDSDSKESIKESGKADSAANLSTMKSASQKLNDSVAKLQKTDYSKVKSPEDMMDDVKNLVSSYNSTVNAAKNLNSYSILQTTVWMTGNVSKSSGILSKMGISVNEDNTLSLDEDKFKKAQMSTIKSVFSGGGFASRLSQKASSLSLQSANQIAVNTGKKTYTSSGTIKY